MQLVSCLRIFSPSGGSARSPLDAWCHNLSEREINSHEYLQTLIQKESELEEIARDNINRNLSRARSRYDAGKGETEVGKGDLFMLK